MFYHRGLRHADRCANTPEPCETGFGDWGRAILEMLRRRFMKAKVRYSAALLVCFVLCLAAPFCSAEGNGVGEGESNKVTIEIDKFGKKIGVPEEETVMPDGKKAMAQKWGEAELQIAVAELKRYYNDPEKTYMVTTSPHPAVCLAFIQALQPLDVLYLYNRPGETEVPMCSLPKVKRIPDPDTNYGVRFEIIEDGDNLFINFNSDSPEATAQRKHSFDINDICKLTIPEIPAGKHLFLHARGRYCVMVVLAFNYISDCKSVSIAYHENDYKCAVSFSEDIEVGKVTPRTLPNDL